MRCFCILSMQEGNVVFCCLWVFLTLQLELCEVMNEMYNCSCSVHNDSKLCLEIIKFQSSRNELKCNFAIRSQERCLHHSRNRVKTVSDATSLSLFYFFLLLGTEKELIASGLGTLSGNISFLFTY